MNKRIGNYCYKVDIGNVRKTNEDVAIALTNSNGDALLMVCDGMGGHKRGDVAANIVIDTIKNEFGKIDKFSNILEVKSFLKKAIKRANKLVYEMAKNENTGQRMGTTLSLVLIRKNGMFIVNIGDSRAYVVEDSLTQLTSDDTYVNYLYKIGKINFEDIDKHPQRHILTNALGLFPNPTFDIDYCRYDNNRILVCSDGLYNSLSDEEMLTILTTSESVNEKCELLIKTANRNGGLDNSAVVLWEVSK